MAQLYYTGVSRILYKARGFASGKSVTAHIWSPDLVKSELLILTEIGDGLYYLDYDFTSEGAYLGKFYENGISSTYDVFRVDNILTSIQTMQTSQPGGLTID